MLHMYKPPPLGGRGGTPQRVPIYSPPLAPRLARVGVRGEDKARKGRNRRKHAESGAGTVSPETRGARAQRRQRWGQADTFRDALNK